jgi:hypothetical protein
VVGKGASLLRQRLAHVQVAGQEAGGEGGHAQAQKGAEREQADEAPGRGRIAMHRVSSAPLYVTGLASAASVPAVGRRHARRRGRRISGREKVAQIKLN